MTADVRRLGELRGTFVRPPGLDDSRPRALQLTASGRALLVVAVVLGAAAVAACVGMSLVVRQQADDRRAIVERGVVTEGVVTRLWASGDNRQKVEYAFVAGGVRHEGDIKVSAERRRTLRVGSPLAVRYLAERPDFNDLGGRPRSGMPAALPFVIAAVLVACAGLCAFGLRRQWTLLSDGRVAPALVTGHTSEKTQHGTQRQMTYEFLLLSGAVGSGKSQTSDEPPAVGSVIPVIYDPDHPARNRVYPFRLVRPAR